MGTTNPYSRPTKESRAPRRARTPPRNWWSYRLKTSAGIGTGLTIIGFTAGPRGLLMGAIIGFPVAIVVTTVLSAVALFLVKSRLSSDRAAFLGAACGFFSGAVIIGSVIAANGGMPDKWSVSLILSLLFAFLLYGGAAAVGGWVGSQSWSERHERAQVRNTVARVRRRRLRNPARR